MEKLQVEIELLSETIFGSGEAVSNSIDIEVLQDNLGIPYMKGKTFKGKLREEMEEIVELLKESTGKDYKEQLRGLLGVEGGFNNDNSGVLETVKFSNCEISKNIKDFLKDSLEKREILREDILAAFTEVRIFTAIDDKGIAKDGSLRESRVVRRDFKYYVDINSARTLTTVDKGLLAMGISALRNLGSMESRGKGEVYCKLLENGKDVTKGYIENLERELI